MKRIRYHIGHPAYSGANAMAIRTTKKELYKLLRSRGVAVVDAKYVCANIGPWKDYGKSYMTVYANGQNDVIEVKSSNWWD